MVIWFHKLVIFVLSQLYGAEVNFTIPGVFGKSDDTVAFNSNQINIRLIPCFMELGVSMSHSQCSPIIPIFTGVNM